MLSEKKGFIDRLKQGLEKTRKLLFTDINEILFRNRKIDQSLYDELEEILIKADIGPALTFELIDRVKDHVRRKEIISANELIPVLKEIMRDILIRCEEPLVIPDNVLYTIMVVGVNGTGKTTTIAKLAHEFKQKGKSVMLVAADTFRAAAIEQLDMWSKRVGVAMISQKVNADPAAVIYDGLQAAKARGINIVIVDTAGRLHTKVNLMEELKKIRRIMARELPGAPHEVLLVIDATTGQNGIVQARTFKEEAGVTGIALTKLDGTAKGGVILRIASELRIPIRYIGIGEGLDDLRPFSAREFVDALFEEKESGE
ncbi:MAG: signal recognition particle-docking protein FtsY [Syntrophales bacterium]|nr:signal recognition particle-docking protein FtsY [Syntrophales bacterium]